MKRLVFSIVCWLLVGALYLYAGSLIDAINNRIQYEQNIIAQADYMYAVATADNPSRFDSSFFEWPKHFQKHRISSRLLDSIQLNVESDTLYIQEQMGSYEYSAFVWTIRETIYVGYYQDISQLIKTMPPREAARLAKYQYHFDRSESVIEPTYKVFVEQWDLALFARYNTFKKRAWVEFDFMPVGPYVSRVIIRDGKVQNIDLQWLARDVVWSSFIEEVDWSN